MGNLSCNSDTGKNEASPNFCAKKYEIKKPQIAINLRDLFDLILNGDLQGLKKRLTKFSVHQRKEIVDSYTEDNSSCLGLAYQEGNIDIFEYLLRKCNAFPDIFIRLESRSASEETALLASAICSEQLDFITLLIKFGANVNFKDHRNCYPIHYACQTGNRQITSILIQAGADVNCVNNDGLSPVVIAAKFCLNRDIGFWKHTSLIELLENEKVNPESQIDAYEILVITSAYAYFRFDRKILRGLGVEGPMHFLYHKVELHKRLLKDRNFSPCLFKSVFFKHITYVNCDTDIENIEYGDIRILYKHLLVQSERLLGLADNHTAFFLKCFANIYSENSLCFCYNTQNSKGLFETFLNIFEFISGTHCQLDKSWMEYIYEALSYWLQLEELCNEHEDALLCFCYAFVENLGDFIPKHTSANKCVSDWVFESVLRLLPCIMKLNEDVWKPAISPTLSTIIARDLRSENENGTLLHMAVALYMGVGGYKLKNGDIVTQYLVKSGMSVNATDSFGNTPLLTYLLHAEDNSFVDEDTLFGDVFNKLYETSHLDIRNKMGQSALSVLKTTGFPVCEVKCRSLQCLAAEVIQCYKGLNLNNLPVSLIEFISYH